MRRAPLGLLAVAALAAPAPAGARVELMVVGHTQTLLAARSVGLGATTVKIGHRSCRVPAATALAGLLAARLSVRVTDAAACDPASMFVRRIGNEANRGLGGWEYKVGRRDPSSSAADPAGRLRPGQQLLWYWCVRAGACQRSLTVSIRFATATAIVHVVGYDENGHGSAVPGATVHFGSSTATTDSRGSITLPLAPGRYLVYATRTGMVRSFPTVVDVTP